jgi:hypothetical protein
MGAILSAVVSRPHQQEKDHVKMQPEHQQEKDHVKMQPEQQDASDEAVMKQYEEELAHKFQQEAKWREAWNNMPPDVLENSLSALQLLCRSQSNALTKYRNFLRLDHVFTPDQWTEYSAMWMQNHKLGELERYLQQGFGWKKST